MGSPGVNLEGRPVKRTRRVRQTHPRVRFAETLSRLIITVGGLGTILAVSLICGFLVWVAAPLFFGAQVEPGTAVSGLGAGSPERRVLHGSVDEYGLLAWSVLEDGTLRVARLDSGELLEERALLGGAAPTSSAFDRLTSRIAFGLADGTVHLGSLGFRSRFLRDEELSAELRALRPGEVAEFERGVVQRTPEGSLRTQQVALNMEQPVDLGGAAIEAIDVTQAGGESMFVVLTAAGRLALFGVSQRENLMSGEVVTSLREGDLPYARAVDGTRPLFLGLGGSGTEVYLVWEDGRCSRYDVRNLKQPRLAEQLDLVPEPGERLTALAFMGGKTTLVTGDSLGRVRGWFRIQAAGASTQDGAQLVAAHDLLPAGGPAVTALATSLRTRTLVVGFEDARIELYYLTSHAHLGGVASGLAGAVRALAFAPRQDLLVAWDAVGCAALKVDLGHPGADLAALFRPLWYEGYEAPAHVWQSSSGSDDFEPKLGLVPLILGTLKATFYSMIFGAPLALLAAIYSSEFLDRRLRAPVKSAVEIMAGLPSVVLGFLAALVIAPFVAQILPGVLLSFVAVPFVLLLAAHLWQLLPQGLTVQLQGWPRFALTTLTLPLGFALALLCGPTLERWLFDAQLSDWLDGDLGSAFGGWVLLLLPLSCLVTPLLLGSLLGTWSRRVTTSWDRRQCAWFALSRFLVGALVAVGLALALSALVSAAGFDPRGALLDTYVQRNALVVGFVMGFAVVPIIYTIAEDALSSVPEHLRLASLGAGATHWQTAVRVIVPTAMSGLFSAVMIGLGRAVGETMIVVMATGNTPIMEWNPFSGFRTLSANIAVELPEAVRGDTHYRTLFLAALVLFAMTFAVNTVAEVVRQRFRRRAFQL